jgi:hypothetical protein
MACLHKALQRFRKRQIIMKMILAQTAIIATPAMKLISKIPNWQIKTPELTPILKVKSRMETTSAV